mmetsp:Transcript_18944/g.40307  ORF Transcript_18944/g.40307 Transcript_18944/m.40307 type:complete len:275 (-) Transcript_18944:709-1533(-)
MPRVWQLRLSKQLWMPKKKQAEQERERATIAAEKERQKAVDAANKQAREERESATKLADQQRQDALDRAMSRVARESEDRIKSSVAAQLQEAKDRADAQLREAVREAVAREEQRAREERFSVVWARAHNEGMQAARASALEQQQTTVEQATTILLEAIGQQMNGTQHLLQHLRMESTGNRSSYSAASHQTPAAGQAPTPSSQPTAPAARESGNNPISPSTPPEHASAYQRGLNRGNNVDAPDQQASSVFQFGEASTPVAASRPPPPGGQPPSSS